MVPAVRRVPPAARRDDGCPDRPRRARLPPLPSRRADGDGGRLPGRAPRARGRHPTPGRSRPPVARSVVHTDGRVPRVRRVPHPQPRARARAREGARRRVGGRLYAGSVRAHRSDAAAARDAGPAPSGRLARRPGLDRAHGLPLAGAGRDERPDRVPGVRLRQRGGLPRAPGRVGAGRGDPLLDRGRPRLPAGRPDPRDDGHRSRRPRPDAPRARGRRRRPAARRRGPHRRPRAAPGRPGARGPAEVAGRAALLRPSAPASQRLLGARRSEARARAGRGARRAVRRTAGSARARRRVAGGAARPRLAAHAVERRARFGVRVLARPGCPRRRRPVRAGALDRRGDRRGRARDARVADARGRDRSVQPLTVRSRRCSGARLARRPRRRRRRRRARARPDRR